MSTIKPIDYRDLLKNKDKEIAAEEERTKGLGDKEKESALGGLSSYWMTIDAKTKRNIIVLVVVILALIGTLVFYLVREKIGSAENLYSAPAIEDWELTQ